MGGIRSVAEPCLWSRPGQGAHSGHHPAMILQVVIGVEDVVLAVVLVLDCDLDRRESASHGVAVGVPVAGAAVREPRPREVHVGKVGLRTPGALLDHGQHTGAVDADVRERGRQQDPRTASHALALIVCL